jgi:transmembrane sensor
MTPAERDVAEAKLARLSEAGEWLLRMQSPSRSDEDINEWLRWCDADPEHLAVYETLQRDWNDLDALKAPRASPRSGRPWVAWAAAAGVAAFAFAFAFAWARREGPVPAPASPPVAAMGTNRAATLPDGSKMILGAQSVVNVDFNGRKRKLDLSSGEAYFKVQRDVRRPFEVRAGEIVVTAIGTAFDVRRQRDRVVVTVEEGVVEVANPSTASGGAPVATWRAEAGYQVTYSSRLRTASIASVDPVVALAWRGGELAYVREPLGSVVEDLNRYSSRKIVIRDPRVAELPFTGTAFASSLEDWLAGVEQAYSLEVTESASGSLVLSARE